MAMELETLNFILAYSSQYIIIITASNYNYNNNNEPNPESLAKSTVHRKMMRAHSHRQPYYREISRCCESAWTMNPFPFGFLLSFFLLSSLSTTLIPLYFFCSRVHYVVRSSVVKTVDYMYNMSDQALRRLVFRSGVRKKN